MERAACADSAETVRGPEIGLCWVVPLKLVMHASFEISMATAGYGADRDTDRETDRERQTETDRSSKHTVCY